MLGAALAPTASAGDRSFTHELKQLAAPADKVKADKPAKPDKAGPTKKAAEAPAPEVVLPPPGSETVSHSAIAGLQVPIFLLPIYQAAGSQYGVRWEILAAINEVETDYGRNLKTSSAGAKGWMQFMPSSWKTYGVDANNDGRKDPDNPVDAIFAAARYLDAAGYRHDVRQAIFAYNHADWYVDDVIQRAAQIARVPAVVTNALTGLSEGRFPVDGHTRQRGSKIYGRPGAAVVAVADGRITKVGGSKKRGAFVVLQDSYGNRFTYSGLTSVENWDQGNDRQHEPGRMRVRAAGKKRVFANPQRMGALQGEAQALDRDGNTGDAAEKGHTRHGGHPVVRLRKGTEVSAGTVLGRIADTHRRGGARMRFEIRPAGRKSPSIHTQPVLEGWRLLEKTDAYGPGDDDALTPGIGVGAVLQMTGPQLERRVLADGRIRIYDQGRRDISEGAIDRRVLATLEYLAESGLSPTVSSLRSGHSKLTASGNISYHWIGNAVDISEINGTPILGHQQPGGVADQAVQAILRLQGAMRPAEVISLLNYGGPSFALPDHDDHVHVGFAPAPGEEGLGHARGAKLRANRWDDVIDQVEGIPQPKVKGKSGKKAKGSKKLKKAKKGTSGD
jgi:murein DD-endopeptidase MepM/ murein hydrolase activator NlpD